MMDIRIEDLFYIYESNGETVVALRGLHLQVASGECLVIKGPNGSGKSTLVKLLTGFYTPTAGKIFIGDRDISKIDPLQLRREYVASIDQRGNLLPDLTILENISLAYSLNGHSHSNAKRLSGDLLKKHDLSQIAHRYQGELSAGERQFSSLLAAIATNPRVLIADEPSGELDNSSAEIMYNLITSLSDETSVILVTHDQRAEHFADRIVQIRDGRISEEWKPGEEPNSVVDPFGWKRVRDNAIPFPERIRFPNIANRQSILRGMDLALTYGDKEIFSHINIDGAQGELIALSSNSGSGKSSLLRILGGIQDPTGGEVWINGQSLKGLSRQERAILRNEFVGYLDQGGSALANIALEDHLGKMRDSFDPAFSSRMNRPLSSFSGGELARIELLKILAEGKQILLLDEPTSQMDERRSLEAAGMIFAFIDAGGLVVTSTREPMLLENATVINFRPI